MKTEEKEERILRVSWEMHRFDCDVCGCQLVVKERMKQVDDIN